MEALASRSNLTVFVQIELECVCFLWREENQRTQRNLQSKARTNNKLNPHEIASMRIESGS